jgi:hypothetical protein
VSALLGDEDDSAGVMWPPDLAEWMQGLWRLFGICHRRMIDPFTVGPGCVGGLAMRVGISGEVLVYVCVTPRRVWCRHQ